MIPQSQTQIGTKIRVLAVDDHPLVRKGIASILANEEDMELVGEAGDGREAVQKFHESHPDVVLMDLRMPQVDGIEAARLMRQADPGVRIVGMNYYVPALAPGKYTLQFAIGCGSHGSNYAPATHRAVKLGLGPELDAVPQGRPG